MLIRGQRVILAADLARIYGVPVKRINEQVRRNRSRFPVDFMFQLTRAEFTNLKSQIATSSWGGARRARPYAFTEHGVVMAANLLRSPRAARVSVLVVRAFVKLRIMLTARKELAIRLDELEHKLHTHDDQTLNLFDAIRQLMDQPEAPPQPPIGYATEATGQKLACRPIKNPK